MRPLLRAAPFFGKANDKAVVQILTDKQQTDLGSIATEVSVRRRSNIYENGSPAHWVYIVREGLVKAYRDLSSGQQRVLAFLFPGDMFGLAEHGLYVNSTQAVVRSSCFKIPVSALTDIFLRDSELELQFLIKMTHELRETQRQQILLTNLAARNRVAMFLHMLQRRGGVHSARIELPMSRTDIARYLGLSSEAVSRAFSRLRQEGVIALPTLHLAQILNRPQFERLARGA
jgi:CRP-like cAMP-binding protein